MKKILLLILFLAGLTTCSGQVLNGVWMSYNNRRIDPNKGASGLGMVGLILDFQKLELGHYLKDTVIGIEPNFRKHKIKTEIGRGKLRFKAFGQDSLVMDFGKEGNMATVFRPLDLSHKLNISEDEITDFLINSKLKSLKEFELAFTNELEHFESITDKPRTKKRNLNSFTGQFSYWFLKEIKQNYLLIFSIDINSVNIYQIITMSDNGVVLKSLQEDYPLTGLLGIKTGLLELKTCL